MTGRRPKRSGLLLLAIAAMFLMLAVTPAIRYVVVKKFETITGAKVRVARCDLSARTCEVLLQDIIAVNRHVPSSVVFRADRIVLQLEKTALWRARTEVTRGLIDGLVINSHTCGTAARLETSNPDADDQARQSVRRRMTGWLQGAQQTLQEAPAADPKSIQLAKKLIEQWPQRTESVCVEVVELRQNVSRLRATLTSAGENPLRNADYYQKALGELDQFTRRLSDLRQQIGQVQHQWNADKKALDAARRVDEQSIENQVLLPAEDPSVIATYLWEEDIRRQVAMITSWLVWGQNLLPTLRNDPIPLGKHGTRVVFTGQTPVSDVLLRSLVLRGRNADPRFPFKLEGTVRGLGSHPSRDHEPAEIVIQTTGCLQAAIHASFDHLGDESLDTISVQFPQWQRSEFLLGDAEPFGIIVGAGVHQTNVQLVLRGDILEGSLSMITKSPQLTPRFGPTLSGSDLGAILAQAIQAVNSMQVQVTLSGSLEHPRWEVSSSVGAQIANDFSARLQSSLVEQRRAHLRAAHERLAHNLQSLELQLSRQQNAVLDGLQSGEEEVGEIVQYVAERVELTDGILDADSPLRETYLR
jgi:uncharacterized protein (TIGR03545 family)